MSEFNNPATNTSVVTFDITAAELVGANKGQRPDLINRPGGIYRTPDGKLYSSQNGQLLAANNLTLTAAYDPLTGGVTGIVGPTGDFLVVASTAPSNADGRPNGTIYIQTV
jgi:hypothetical protein